MAIRTCPLRGFVTGQPVQIFIQLSERRAGASPLASSWAVVWAASKKSSATFAASHAAKASSQVSFVVKAVAPFRRGGAINAHSRIPLKQGCDQGRGSDCRPFLGPPWDIP